MALAGVGRLGAQLVGLLFALWRNGTAYDPDRHARAWPAAAAETRPPTCDPL